jgi:hypothetical protein
MYIAYVVRFENIIFISLKKRSNLLHTYHAGVVGSCK